MTGRASRPEDCEFQHSNLRTGAFDERQADQRSSPPHDRGHDGPQLWREDTARLYPAYRDLCQISRPLPRYREWRRHPRLPARTGRAGCAATEDEYPGLGVALLLHHHTRPRDLAHQLARTHYPPKLPRVPSREQVARLIEAAPGPGLEYKTALSIAYGAG